MQKSYQFLSYFIYDWEYALQVYSFMLKLCNPNGWKCDMQSKYMTLKFTPNYLSAQHVTNFHVGATNIFCVPND